MDSIEGNLSAPIFRRRDFKLLSFGAIISAALAPRNGNDETAFASLPLTEDGSGELGFLFNEPHPVLV